MGGRYSYRIEEGIAWIVIHGEQKRELMLDVQNRLAADPGFRPDIPKLIDGRRVTNWMSTEDIAAIREFTDVVHGGIDAPRRVAMLSSDSMVSKISKLSQDIISFGPQSGLVEHKFFRSEAEAVAWLKEAPSPRS